MWSQRQNFFEDVVGLSEDLFRQYPERIKEARPEPGKLKNLRTGEVFDSGRFTLKTLGELRAQDRPSVQKDIAGTFHLLYSRDDPSQLDIGHLQSLPTFQNALFQVASNFNALELMGPYDKRAMTQLSAYILDQTQGPYASISAAPGLIARHYYAFEKQGMSPETWSQQYDGPQLEMLRETPLRVRNGYVMLEEESLEQPALPEDMAVLVHRNIEVTFGQSRDHEHRRLANKTQLIDQVFTATLDLGSRQRHFLESAPKEVTSLGKALLRAAYEATLLAAIQGGNRKVVLTLIGGGVFCNPSSWIVEAIEDLLPLIVESGLTVYLNAFRGPGSPNSLKRLRSLVEQSGGLESEAP